MTTTSLPKLSGACLCRAVRFTFKLKSLHADACHCDMCRTWSGGVAMSVTSDGPVHITEGESQVCTYKSSQWGERCFCKTCGTNLFMNCPEYGYYCVTAGVLDETPSGLTLSKQIFIDKKPSYYSFTEETENMTKAEFLAMFSSGEDEGNDDGK